MTLVSGGFGSQVLVLVCSGFSLVGVLCIEFLLLGNEQVLIQWMLSFEHKSMFLSNFIQSSKSAIYASHSLYITANDIAIAPQL